MSLVSARGLSVTLSGNKVLDRVDLEVSAGEIVTLVGPNGSGKTTLLRALLGAVPPASGTVRRSPGLRVGYLPQRLSLDWTLPLSVGRFLRLPRRGGRDPAAALSWAGAAGLERRQMTELSGGEFQRVLLARALMADPQILILDEPTAGLDQPGAAAFYRRIESVRAETGAAVLLISHDLHVVMAASDRVICLNGHVCCHGTPESVASAPQYRALFGTGTAGALALYRHDHDHAHHTAADHDPAKRDPADTEPAG